MRSEIDNPGSAGVRSTPDEGVRSEIDNPGSAGVRSTPDEGVRSEIDRIERELSVELPLHMRAFARAHVSRRTPPAAPLIARLVSTLETAIAASQSPQLQRRGLALLRLVAPIAIEDDPDVARARGCTPSWEGLVRLTRARDAAAHQRFGIGAMELFHTLHGTLDSVADPNASCAALEPVVEGWQAPGPGLDAIDAKATWTVIAAQLGISGSVRIDRAVAVRPRTFVVAPGREVIVVVPAEIDSPMARFEFLHELGHAAAALVLDEGVPRVIDEGAAAYVARLMELPTWLPSGWTSALAVRARHRRQAIAVALDGIERALPDLPRVVGAVPPWGLWNDPGAQASYAAAEVIADRLHRELGTSPVRGEFARALRAETDRIDRG